MNNIRNRFHDFQNRRLPTHEIEEIRKGLLEESTTDNIYLVLIVGSCIIATLGLLSNSTAVIIGAMIVAPLMLPIRGIAFGALEGNAVLFRKGFIDRLQNEYPNLQEFTNEQLRLELLTIEADTYAEFVKAGRLNKELAPFLQQQD